jgi:hypothetical protein
MGIYNDGRPLDEPFKSKICPFCKSSMTPLDRADLRDSDSFEYLCASCNPKVIISFTGSLTVNITNVVEKHGDRLNYYKKDISACTNEIIRFTSAMFN